jgi:hypothetical protein
MTAHSINRSFLVRNLLFNKNGVLRELKTMVYCFYCGFWQLHGWHFTGKATERIAKTKPTNEIMNAPTWTLN